MGSIFTKVRQEDINYHHVLPNGKNQLHLAAERGDVNMAKILLAQGFAAAKVDNIEQNPLHLAARHGKIDILKLLLIHDNTLHKTTTLAGYAPLHLAVEKGHIESIRFLLTQGADINQAVTNRKYTPLHLAVEKGNIEVVELLVAQKNININSLTNANRTPLFAAAWLGHDSIVEILLKNGANSKQVDVEGNTALSIAMYTEKQMHKLEHRRIIKLLVERECSIDTIYSVKKVNMPSKKIGVTSRWILD